jgi:hypothetical protein
MHLVNNNHVVEDSSADALNRFDRSFSTSNPLRGCNSDLAQYSITPTLRVAGFEDEDENEAPSEELRTAVKITLGPDGRPGSQACHPLTGFFH